MSEPVFRIYKLETDDGVCPFDRWFLGLRDKATRARIVRQIDKIGRGNFGTHREFDGIAELKLDFGPGYRVYFARYGDVIIILLGGGDKSSQQRDIERAKQHWANWKKAGAEINGLTQWPDENTAEEDQ